METDFLEFLPKAAIIAALPSAFAIALLRKWGCLELAQARAPRLLSELAGCGLCLSFWASALISALAALITGDARWLAAPLFSTPVTRALL